MSILHPNYLVLESHEYITPINKKQFKKHYYYFCFFYCFKSSLSPKDLKGINLHFMEVSGIHAWSPIIRRGMDNHTLQKQYYVNNLKSKSQTVHENGFKLTISELQHARPSNYMPLLCILSNEYHQSIKHQGPSYPRHFIFSECYSAAFSIKSQHQAVNEKKEKIW